MNKALKKSLKIILGIFIFFIGLGIGGSIKMDSNLINTETNLNKSITTNKEDLNKVHTEISDAKSQKDKLEKEINNLKEELNKTNDSIQSLEQSGFN